MPKTIAELQLRDAFDESCNVPIDDTIQTYRITGQQLLAFIKSRYLAAHAGMVSAYAGDTAPQGWLFCRGQEVSRDIYADLFLAIGTTYGVGNGSTTFTLPDLRGEFIRGLDASKGTDNARTLGTAQASQTGQHLHSYGSLSAVAANAPHNHPQPSTNTAGDHQHYLISHIQGTTDLAPAPYASRTLGRWALYPSANDYTLAGNTADANRGVSGSGGAHAHTTPSVVGTSNAPHGHTMSGSTGLQGGTENSNETRPRNIALNYIIKV